MRTAVTLALFLSVAAANRDVVWTDTLRRVMQQATGGAEASAR